MDPADSLESLGRIDPVFSAGFEFVKNAENPLRLEVLFEKSPGCQEIEQGGFSWFKAQAGKKDIFRVPLQLGMIDFARYVMIFIPDSPGTISHRRLHLDPTGKRMWSSSNNPRQVLSKKQ